MNTDSDQKHQVRAGNNTAGWDLKFNQADWPRTTVDKVPGGGREWIHPEMPRYYLHRYPGNHQVAALAARWVVIDRYADLAVTPYYRRKADCIRNFVRQFDPQPHD